MTQDTQIKIVLVGGSGYAGFEALRWLQRHPNAEVVGVFGPESEVGPMDEFYPLLTGQCALQQELFTVEAVAEKQADIAMLCVPHKVAMAYVPQLRELGLKVIDWSADYRLNSRDLYESWYCPHTDADRLDEAVYGLPEYFADDIAKADLVANPGCYPTCTSLAVAPILKAGLIQPTGIVVNAISGVSGAGRKPNLALHYPEANESFKPYGVGGHRHQPEMEQVLSTVSGKDVDLLFQPHLCPMDRGMLCSIYADPTPDATPEKLMVALIEAYADTPFVRVREGGAVNTKHVAWTNYCDVSATMNKGKVEIFSVLDNLLKGASTQAIQNMNLMFGLEETTGLY
jgi:N-acetyl-gamma-glutamyl-phosphate reductase